MSTRFIMLVRPSLAMALALAAVIGLAWAGAVRAQSYPAPPPPTQPEDSSPTEVQPQPRRTGPRIPDVRKRSGLFTRQTPIEPKLPVDSKRDIYLGTRWEPRHRWRQGRWINSFLDGGLYGRKLTTKCTACLQPFFKGAPGNNTLCPDCEPPNRYHRWFSNFVQPFRPVDEYYAGGCYVPVYDLDPFVPGPGPFPWSYFPFQHIGH